jgi:DNA-directed RNA polymerase subunit RPC12/RpoP
MAQESPSPRRTGLVCIICGEAVAYVENTSTFGLHIHCPACTHRWLAEDPTAPDYQAFLRPIDARPSTH